MQLTKPLRFCTMQLPRRLPWTQNDRLHRRLYSQWHNRPCHHPSPGVYLYTAPSPIPMTRNTVTHTAISQADPTKTASSTITLHLK